VSANRETPGAERTVTLSLRRDFSARIGGCFLVLMGRHLTKEIRALFKVSNLSSSRRNVASQVFGPTGRMPGCSDSRAFAKLKVFPITAK